MQQESSRKCKICGSPNHHGCGCEAKRRQADILAMKSGMPAQALANSVHPKSEKPAPAESKIFASKEEVDDVLSMETIIESHKSNMQMAEDVKRMADGWEGLCALMYDTNNYLKLIAGDVITIRKMLSKEDEVKNGG